MLNSWKLRLLSHSAHLVSDGLSPMNLAWVSRKEHSSKASRDRDDDRVPPHVIVIKMNTTYQHLEKFIFNVVPKLSNRVSFHDYYEGIRLP